jgi:hypothetical protein
VFAHHTGDGTPEPAEESTEQIGELERDRKGSTDWVAGPFDGEQFEIAGDEADDSTIGSFREKPASFREKQPSLREKSNSFQENKDKQQAQQAEDMRKRAQTSPAIPEEEPGFLGHVVRWFGGDTQGPNEPGVLLEAPVPVSEAELKKELEIEEHDLEEAEEETKGDEPQQKKVYKDITELLESHLLGQFVLSFHKHGVDSINELKGCTDAFLTEQVGMKKAHILKFRRALKDADIMPQIATFSVYEAVDGFRGTYEDVLAHEQKLGLLDNGKKYKLYEAPDGFRGSYEEVLAHETMLAKLNQGPQKFKLYEAADGLFRGSYEEVIAYEHRKGLDNDDPVILRIYEAEDGFRGTYEEVLAHEKKLESGNKSSTGSKSNKDEPVLFRIYEAPDGFRGTYDEVVAYEKKMGFEGEGGGIEMKSRGGNDGEEALFKLYEAPDGFRGSYEEVLAHERAMGIEAAEGDEQVFSLYEAPDGFRGTYEEVVEHEKKLGLFDDSNMSNIQQVDASEPVLFRVYEAPDGFRGTYEQVLEHERKHNLNRVAKEDGDEEEREDANDPVIYRIYESDDGLCRGTYDEVVAYEKKNGIYNENQDIAKPKSKLTYQLYEAPDGFRGSYEEVLAHEQELAANLGLASPAWDKKSHIYKSPDGFEGLHAEVLAHEKEMGYIELNSDQIFIENPKLLLKAVENFQSQVSRLNARVAELEKQLAESNNPQLKSFNDFTSGL